MIYAEPIVRHLADSYVGIEFGDDADLRNNFRVIALVQAFAALELDWALEVIPTLREFGVVYDRMLITPAKVEAIIMEMLPDIVSAEQVSSRLFKLPVWYRDPWTEAINERAGLDPSIEIVAATNGCSVAEVIARHSGTDHWVSCVGWAPGCYFAYPLDRVGGVSAPKLDTARSYTPERVLTLGGLCTAALPFPAPSGYQMLGRLAAPIYRPQGDIAGFPEHGVLFQAGDRHRYTPVDALGYEAVQEKITNGTYEYDVSTETFSFATLVAGGYTD
jgi:allophanate hydrolase subunit 1